MHSQNWHFFFKWTCQYVIWFHVRFFFCLLPYNFGKAPSEVSIDFSTGFDEGMKWNRSGLSPSISLSAQSCRESIRVRHWGVSALKGKNIKEKLKILTLGMLMCNTVIDHHVYFYYTLFAELLSNLSGKFNI